MVYQDMMFYMSTLYRQFQLCLYFLVFVLRSEANRLDLVAVGFEPVRFG